jgi:hypothetical protein
MTGDSPLDTLGKLLKAQFNLLADSDPDDLSVGKKLGRIFERLQVLHMQLAEELGLESFELQDLLRAAEAKNMDGTQTLKEAVALMEALQAEMATVEEPSNEAVHNAALKVRQTLKP